MTRFAIVLCAGMAVLGRARESRAGPFEVRDSDWEGCSEFFEMARAELGEDRALVRSQLDWGDLRSDDGLLLLHPDHAVSGPKLANFLAGGGRVAIVDDFGAGAKILADYQIERVTAPARPLAALRRKAVLAIAEPVREAAGQAAEVHPTVAGVERLVTNHPSGLRSLKEATPVLKIRSVDEPDVILALAGKVGPRGKLFAMGDPSALMNQMLRYPGNRAFALGLIRYLAEDHEGEGRRGRLVVVANEFTETGTNAETGSLRSELDERVENAAREIGKLMAGGFSGVTGLACAAAVALAVALWTTSVASRVYQRVRPSFVRPVPLVAQGGAPGRAAVLSARTTPRELVVLELKSALEEGVAHEVGLYGHVSSPNLLAEVQRKGTLDERDSRTLKGILLEMATIETLVAAGQPERVGRPQLVRLGRTVFELLSAVRKSSRERSGF